MVNACGGIQPLRAIQTRRTAVKLYAVAEKMITWFAHYFFPFLLAS